MLVILKEIYTPPSRTFLLCVLLKKKTEVWEFFSLLVEGRYYEEIV
jgi:hypothetical protein